MTLEKAAAPDGALIGQSIDERYRLEGVIGVGGLGSVYRATHTKLQRPVAVKMLHENFGESQVQRGRFAREAKALAALQHPNIVSVLDYGVSDTRLYLVMELLEGETLSQRLQRGPLAVESALRIVQQLLEALAFMHRAQLVHRDVKPSNVFLQRMRDGQERVKVLDLGLAKFTASPAFNGGDPTLTRDGAILGTPAYMSPEQATGEAVDARSDVYAVGVILFRMLSGRLPFEGDAIEQVRSHLIAPVPALERAEPDHQLDPTLESLIRRAMAKRREDRFDDAGEMLRVLAEAFPQYVRSTLPAHESVLPDPFAVDANNADWLLSRADDPSDAATLPRVPRVGITFESGLRKVGRAVKALVITSVRLFAGVSVLLVVGAGAIFILLLRDEADRVELTALQRRVSDRLIERSLRGGGESVPESSRSPATRPEARASEAAGAVATPVDLTKDPAPLGEARADEATTAAEPATELVAPGANDTALAPSSANAGVDPAGAGVPAPASGTPPTPDLAPSSVPSAAELGAAVPKPGPELGASTRALEAAAPALWAKEASSEGAAGAVSPPELVPQPSAANTEPAVVAEVATVPPRDPWRDPVPPRLRAARKSMLNGGRGSEPMFMAVRDYNKDQRDDPRGHLILGQLYLNRFWRADALSQFSIALQLDPSVRGAPEVLDGLLHLVVHGALAAEAERVITHRFGVDAVPAIERAIEREAKNADPKVGLRLRRLQARLSAPR